MSLTIPARSDPNHGDTVEHDGTGSGSPIAIIGVSGRFPGGANSSHRTMEQAQSARGYGRRVAQRSMGARVLPSGRSKPGRIYTKGFGGLDAIDQFDADFFAISPREANRVDPQHRLLLELAWEALEDAGQDPRRLAGSNTGVFIGISSNDYVGLQIDEPETIDAYTNSGGALSIASNRLSYFFDFHGPSMSIDTACSSSLVAFHQACRSIWSGESTLALAGGANILLNPLAFVGFCKASMLSPDGRCKSFDASGDGFVRAEGGVVLVLKPLAAAERDGDPIHAVIVATGVNSDGRTRGLSLPNEAAQEELLRQVYTSADISPDDVFYVEAHGTGTAAGDPIECGAIGRVLGSPRSADGVCYIGSIKSNIGHLEPASGVAGVAKVLLALKNREIPPNLHFNEPNPKIEFEKLKLKVVDESIPLPRRERPYVMGVNSFGFGGTNAHVAIREYVGGVKPITPYDINGRNGRNGHGEANGHGTLKPSLLLLSAHNPEALSAMAANYAQFLRDPGSPPLRDICATAALRSARLASRLAALATEAGELADRLDRFVAGETPGAMATDGSRRTRTLEPSSCFAERAPVVGMGRELLTSSRNFDRRSPR